MDEDRCSKCGHKPLSLRQIARIAKRWIKIHPEAAIRLLNEAGNLSVSTIISEDEGDPFDYPEEFFDELEDDSEF